MSFMKFFLSLFTKKRLKVGKIKYTFLRIREGVKIMFTFRNFFREHKNFVFIYFFFC